MRNNYPDRIDLLFHFSFLFFIIGSTRVVFGGFLVLCSKLFITIYELEPEETDVDLITMRKERTYI